MRLGQYEYLSMVVEAGLYVIQHTINPDAKELILGTIAIESDFGQYRMQINGGALGICQIERPTFEWLKEKYQEKLPFIRPIHFIDLEDNDLASVIFCRLKYLSIPYALPSGSDVELMAAYWKRWYNTYEGAGKKEDFIKRYNRHVNNAT